MQLETVKMVVHGPAAPTVALAHGTEDVTVSDSVPSPALYASTVCVGPLCPTAMLAGPTVLLTRRSTGAAFAAETRLKARKLETRKADDLTPTREHPS